MLRIFIIGLGVGILIGGLFIAYIAGKDWQQKINAKSFTWKNVTYHIIEAD